MASFQPPPTWAMPILVDEVTKKAIFNPVWLKWFVDLTGVINAAGGGGGTFSHNSLSSIQGGASNDYYHFTGAQQVALTAGFTGTGNLVRATTPTLVTPILGTATATKITMSDGTKLAWASTAWSNGAGAAAGTLLNAPAAGNPTKWIPVDDNGTTRHIPAW